MASRPRRSSKPAAAPRSSARPRKSGPASTSKPAPNAHPAVSNLLRGLPRLSAADTQAVREVFWQNAVREMLTELSVLCATASKPSEPADQPARSKDQSDAKDQPPSSQPSAQPHPFAPVSPVAALTAAHPDPQPSERDAPADPPTDAAQAQAALEPSLFDGRLAVVLTSGQRVAIAHVAPLFSFGISQADQRGLAIAVDASIFQIRTPDGQVFTVPIHEVRAIHALTSGLMDRLQRRQRRSAARDQMGEDAPPFGFAAFTSTARSLFAPPPLPPEASPHPLE